ncbi:MAG TPA: hypothetical protein VFL91_19130 [Thermomicrobiales bacterium]|nr:hypothetical protein [Thermomicrobiales bacterium]
MLDECDHMARLVDDLLHLSRLDARRLPLDCQAVPLAPLLADVVRQVARADAARLRQVLLILLDNALRHTLCGGRITLVARAEGPRAWRSPTPARASRPSTCPTSSSGSTGPRGRARRPARALVEAQRRAIGVASRPGQGTTVSITLPAAP